VTILSPAKINLILRILGQREDGYHLLQTYFQLLDWGDKMNFDLIDNDDIVVEGQFGQLNSQDNLIYKAAQLLNPYKNSKKGILIKVEKNIPQGSGLGGGSSNAGTTLRILNKIWKCHLNTEQLIELALNLGADVPIFIQNQSAMAKGIGEILQPYDIEKYFFVLIFPPISIATADIFQKKSLRRNQLKIELEKTHNQSHWTNACLPVVLRDYPQVNSIYQTASKLTQVYMSGTGSTLFTCFDQLPQAQKFIQQCPTNWTTKICRSKSVEKY